MHINSLFYITHLLSLQFYILEFQPLMTIQPETHHDLYTSTGPMRTHLFEPSTPGPYPALILYSEIFQLTGPIRRTAALLAGHGYIVAVPEVYHELESPGTVLAYDQAGADKGNFNKFEKEVSAYDSDARALLDHLKSTDIETDHGGKTALHYAAENADLSVGRGRWRASHRNEQGAFLDSEDSLETSAIVDFDGYEADESPAVGLRARR